MPIQHGTETGYNHFKCRCDACREAARVARYKRRKMDPWLSRWYDREYKRARRQAGWLNKSALSSLTTGGR